MNWKAMFGQESAPVVSDAIMTRPADPPFPVSFSDMARNRKETALEAALSVTRCSDPDEHRKAVLAQSLLKETLSMVEKSRQEAKKPALEYGRKLDAAVKAFTQQLSDEMLRVSALVGDYQILEQKRVQAEIALREQELAKIERRRLEEIAKTKTVEQEDAINHYYNELARNTPLIEPDRVEGQRISKDWDVTVHDIWALARNHSMCVKIEPLIGEIKNLIKAGLTRIAGVSWKEKIKADVRPTKTPAIDI